MVIIVKASMGVITAGTIIIEVSVAIATDGVTEEETCLAVAPARQPASTTAEFLLEMSEPSPVQVARRLTPVAPDFVSNAVRH